MKNFIALFLFAALFHVPQAWAQCAPGIPEAGNPECLPPDDANSPYYQGDRNQQPVQSQQPRAVWADRWGAIAEDFQASKVGTVVEQGSKSQAEDAALSSCATNGGKKCQITLTYYNQCAAVAVDENNLTLASRASAPTKGKAEQIALAGFGKGQIAKIVYSACSLPVRVQ
jgi:hypothetical protein